MGFIVYLNKPDPTGKAIGVLIVLLGLIVGIVWATRVWKKRGTVEFMSGIHASPELDKKEN